MVDRPIRLRGIALPSEHGGWGLTLEPAALGLAVVPSIPGAALGVAALVAFLTRTPLRLSVGDRLRGRRRRRTRLADRLVVGYGTVGLAAIVLAARLAEGPFWIPLLAALPLAIVQAGYDARSRSRHLIPELVGPVGVGAVAPAIALAGGATWSVSLGLWLVVALRAVASVILVRAQLRRARGQAFRAAPVHVADLAAATIGATAAVLGFLPWPAATALVLLPLLGWWELWRSPVPAVVVGIHQTILGIIVVGLAAAGFRIAR